MIHRLCFLINPGSGISLQTTRNPTPQYADPTTAEPVVTQGAASRYSTTVYQCYIIFSCCSGSRSATLSARPSDAHLKDIGIQDKKWEQCAEPGSQHSPPLPASTPHTTFAPFLLSAGVGLAPHLQTRLSSETNLSLFSLQACYDPCDQCSWVDSTSAYLHLLQLAPSCSLQNLGAMSCFCYFYTLL